MSKEKEKKKKKKESQLVIRVERQERDVFVALCDRMDTSAARELRRFMRNFVESHTVATLPEQQSDSVVAPKPNSEVTEDRRPAGEHAPKGSVEVKKSKSRKVQKRSAS